MTFHPSLRRGLLIVSLALFALPIQAGDDCDVPLSHWQSRDAVRQMAAAKGWEIQRLKIDDGCYEIRATDAEGRAFKAKLDPETLQVLKLKYRDRDRDHDRRRERGEAPRRQPNGGASAPSPAPVPGAAPRGAIE